MSAENYLNPLLNMFSDSRTKKNVGLLFSNIIKAKSIRLWSALADRAGYEKVRRVIGKEVKNVLNDTKVSTALLENSVKSLTKGDLILLHDPSDIRKVYSKKMEELGKVRNLKSEIINGYSSFNTVAIDIHGKKLRLLDSKIYSNRSSHYVKETELTLQKKECPESVTEIEKQRFNEVKKLVADDDYINLAKITQGQLKHISDTLKKEKGMGILTHVLDRKFDSGTLFKFIADELKDKFVIRLKLTRISEEIIINTEEKKCHVKLSEQNFSNKEIITHQKIMIKNRTYQDVKCVLEWGNTLDEYAVVKIQLFNREGKSFFKQPLLVATNHLVTNKDEAFSVYRMYLKRSKIEGVFKFLKEVLGWEEFQIRDFESIKTLLAFCYFVGGYFYEIESVLLEQDFVQFVASLGGGKGKITRRYVLEGLSKLLIKKEVDAQMEEHGITPEKLTQILAWVNASDDLI